MESLKMLTNKTKELMADVKKSALSLDRNNPVLLLLAVLSLVFLLKDTAMAVSLAVVLLLAGLSKRLKKEDIELIKKDLASLKKTKGQQQQQKQTEEVKKDQ